MKTYWVYTIENKNSDIEYVGESFRPYERFWDHTHKKANKFYQRTDVTLNLVKSFDNRKDAYYYQLELQKQYGLITDSENRINNTNYDFMRCSKQQLKMSKNRNHKEIGLKIRKPVNQYDMCGKLIKEYPSIYEAIENTGISHTMIYRVIRGHRRHTHNFIFKYKK